MTLTLTASRCRTSTICCCMSCFRNIERPLKTMFFWFYYKGMCQEFVEWNKNVHFTHTYLLVKSEEKKNILISLKWSLNIFQSCSSNSKYAAQCFKISTKHLFQSIRFIWKKVQDMIKTKYQYFLITCEKISVQKCQSINIFEMRDSYIWMLYPAEYHVCIWFIQMGPSFVPQSRTHNWHK